MRKLPDRRAGTTSPAFRIGPDAEVLSLGLRPEGGASVDRQLRPDGVALASPNCVQTESRRPSPNSVQTKLPPAPNCVCAEPARLRLSGPARPALGCVSRPRPATGCSSPPPPSSVTSSSACRPSCAPRCPTATSAAIVEQAVTEKLQRLEARRFARTQAPRKTLSESQTSPTTRQIPAAVKRAVYERDAGRCRYEDEQGRRCTARLGL